MNDAFALSDYKFRFGFQKSFLLKHYLLLQAGFYLLATILQKSLQHFAISQKVIITALKSSERCFHTFKKQKKPEPQTCNANTSLAKCWAHIFVNCSAAWATLEASSLLLASTWHSISTLERKMIDNRVSP